jgi:hypothetical protein
VERLDAAQHACYEAPMMFLATVGSCALLSGLAVGIALTAGCGSEIITPVGASVAGTWEYDEGGPAPLKIKVSFNADGSVDETVTPGSPLSGAVTVTGLTWTASSGTLSIAGTPSCAGGFTGSGYLGLLARISASELCMHPLMPLNQTLDPNSAPIPNGESLQVVGTGCSYRLSNDGSTLELGNCHLPPITWTSPAPQLPGYVDFTLHRVD